MGLNILNPVDGSGDTNRVVTLVGPSSSVAVPLYSLKKEYFRLKNKGSASMEQYRA
jgi:hypothetical protein